jgi:hypothetical protein|tara:strand:- start:282 stop:1124 length:843 start_codon:yes stop_codon:yes gene_type:complete
MSNGVLLFAFNNSRIDYVKQAIYCAKRIKTHLNLPVQLVTDAIDYIESAYPFYKQYIDVLTYQPAPVGSPKTFHDGIYNKTQSEWKNSARSDAYAISVFEKTLVIDTDLLLFNDKLLSCFNTNEDFMIAKHHELVNLNGINFDRVGDKTIPMYWATILYFTKSNTAKTVFDLVAHIKENYNYYRTVYDIPESKFRNDFAFSIAVHMMSGFEYSTEWPLQLNSDMWVSTDKDVLLDITDTTVKLLAHKSYDYLPVKLTDATVHVMNKFSLNSFIDKEFKNE